MFGHHFESSSGPVTMKYDLVNDLGSLLAGVMRDVVGCTLCWYQQRVCEAGIYRIR